MIFTEEELKLIARALNALANNIRYSLRAPVPQLNEEISEVEKLKEKVNGSL